MTGARRPATRRLLHLTILGALLAGAGAAAQEGAPPQAPAARSADFRLSISPDALVVHRGATGQVTVKIEPVAGFDGTVDMLSSLLYATTTSFSPASIETGSGTAVLSISPSATAIKGEYVLSIAGVNDGNSHSVTVRVTVK